MIEGAEEPALLAHLGACAACRESLESMDQADGLLTLAIAPAQPKVRRFRLLRPALLPLAAALLFAWTLSYVLTAPPAASDSPIAVADMTPAPATPAAEPVANVFLRDRFEGAELHPVWKSSEGSTGATTLVDSGGRKALVLSAQPGGKRKWALLTTAAEYPVTHGVSFDVDYRIPKPQKGGRMQVLLQTKHSKAGRGVLRWSRTAEEELLEAQADGRTKPVVLWSSKTDPSDAGWHQLKLTVTAGDVVLHRDGTEVARKPHGLPLERAALTLGSTLDKRARDSREAFECQIGRVHILREEAR
jgi:hypothetical protein